MAATKLSNTPCSTRKTILQAACQVIIANGAEAMTLEAVAREAGVSKGGLLYHFPNKEALIVAMMDQLVNQRATMIQQAFEEDDAPDNPGRWTRAYIRSFANVDPQRKMLRYSVLAAMLSNPKLLEPVQKVIEDWQKQMEMSGLSPERATLIRLALDGLYFAEMFGFAPPNESLRTEVIETLLELAKPTE
ncbi:TetR/AcrR family transcriptional regulator [Aetokthonos hydrillicola Thurmond2011]|jgi:AcrR family transcriptional regulator|uniref:TetR/AcrR family transcriptional regulator n=1 Tax=Aetokthonos hydrillicola Thurmond2011 TaxID=2712845 RepID=A0AAP5M8P0_9CYAN|nr:TetR/AcrR family transcriptional regulator [Aetokthonos hydrillicola]MBO3464007.1 TetR/AcrR family transcriptional regulator [Aetokthonos hydrillicola CCALA 1050]MBW4584472.1 TetR/AcrR family transcriptional regulator [Aetokthonos hydrillicola CCALA 1050]MDR9896435.1 TetR/AcrR family transcriptional regulator [Aetokthonos hydrillicola Thurmond2011]